MLLQSSSILNGFWFLRTCAQLCAPMRAVTPAENLIVQLVEEYAAGLTPDRLRTLLDEFIENFDEQREACQIMVKRYPALLAKS